MEYAKTILAMIGLVLIGFFAGFFTHQQMTMKRVKTIASIGLKDGFKKHLYHVISPTEEQRNTLDPIVSRYGEKISEIHRKSREERKNTIEQMHGEIKEHLNEEQIEKLKRFSKRFRGKPRLPHPRK